jgi:lysophospholipid acyltransferase (LPLAT)-like uncharacterized protein
MAATKALLKTRAVRRFLSWFGAFYIRLVYFTGRWQTIGVDQALAANEPPYLAAFWHGRMLMMPHLRPRRLPFRMLISRHGDGVMIADTVSQLGIDVIAGSTRKGGATAVREILRSLKAGISIGLTPDGPRGPRMRCSGAIADIARLADVPLLPVSYSAKWRIVFNSWDRFVLPLPFTRGVFLVGQPIEVARDADTAATREILENALNEVTRKADAMMGVETVEPAALKPVEAGGR